MVLFHLPRRASHRAAVWRVRGFMVKVSLIQLDLCRKPATRLRERHFKVSFTHSESDQRALDGEYAALREGVGYRLLEERLIVRVTGDDRLSFFHGMCSADVKGARAGDILPALFLTEHAHVIGDFFIWVEENALTIETDLAAWPREKEHLEKLLVADDVELEEFHPLSVLHVEGPRAADALSSAEISGAHALKPWQCSKSVNTLLGRLPRYGADAFSLLGDRVVLIEVAERLARVGAITVGEASLGVIRVEHGIAKVGVDTAEKTIALEASLQRAISFNKGCYLGQETIERATARGGLKKKLFGLRFAKPVASGSELFLDGKEVGRVTSAVISPRLGALGLAILHHSAWTPGVMLIARDASGEIEARVSELPFDK
jgi:folate-binding protein YgfZ